MTFTKITFVFLAIMFGAFAYDYENHVKLPTLFSKGTSDNEFHFVFDQFKKEFGKEYHTIQEFDKRFNVFITNLKFIKNFNMKNNVSYSLGVNEHTDLTHAEFMDKYLSKNFIVSNDKSAQTSVSFPDSVDWVAKGAVNPMRDQGQCGSCYAFSTVGAIEGAYFVDKGKLLQFSEQQLVDCSKAYGNAGCDGGLMDNGFKYVKDRGLCLRQDYAYTAKVGTCKACTPVADSKIKGFTDIHADELSLTNAITQRPIAVAIEADTQVFQFYKSGVFDNTACGTSLDHAVLAVGYGHDMNVNKDFYTVRNSWGTTWGEKGYIRMVRKSVSSSTAGMCGIAKMASYPYY